MRKVPPQQVAETFHFRSKLTAKLGAQVSRKRGPFDRTGIQLPNPPFHVVQKIEYWPGKFAGQGDDRRTHQRIAQQRPNRRILNRFVAVKHFEIRFAQVRIHAQELQHGAIGSLDVRGKILVEDDMYA